MSLPVQIRRLDPDVPLPAYKTPGAAGFDIACHESVEIAPGASAFVRTGLVVCVPDGHVLLIFGRSSNAKKGIVLSNGVGVIDRDYCGPEDELLLSIRNHGTEPYVIEIGERVAQGVIVPAPQAVFEEVETLDAPNRGGYGTTG